uniref:Uncharacterized protein n=1 Tax=Arundo donax TaxID=35708 RepID=A0A0A9DB74_ARUDO
MLVTRRWAASSLQSSSSSLFSLSSTHITKTASLRWQPLLPTCSSAFSSIGSSFGYPTSNISCQR